MRPVSGKKQKLFQWFSQALKERGIVTESIEFAKIRNYIDYADFILVVDEDEKRAADTFAKSIWGKNFTSETLFTYLTFINRFRNFGQLGDYLRKLDEKGISVFGLGFWGDSIYAKPFIKSIYDKFASIGRKVENIQYPEFYPGFFDDLYMEEYVEDILHIPYAVETKSGTGKFKDCHSRYYNVIDGERYTEGQPNSYIKTVWFVGPCFMYGHYVEDKNTIESFLQRRFNETEYNIRVVNCCSISYTGRSASCEHELSRISTLPLRRGDIVVVYVYSQRYDGVTNLNLYDVLDPKRISADWFIESPAHCNHKVNALYADAIFDALQPILKKTPAKQGELIEQDRDFVKAVYLDKYFAGFAPAQYGKIGAIVMNCNPFTYGHRYLIEQALKTVDFLILFVVEEDKSVFSFHERFAMVRAGVSDLANVKVVPSGPFILSQTSFPEYFIKEADEDLAENVENDVTFFAERIAPHLNITYRFVGEEPEDKVTNEYNAAMKRILPAHGITLVELPRKKINGSYISASRVRQCLEDNDLDGLVELIPQSTREILIPLAPFAKM